MRQTPTRRQNRVGKHLGGWRTRIIDEQQSSTARGCGPGGGDRRKRIAIRDISHANVMLVRRHLALNKSYKLRATCLAKIIKRQSGSLSWMHSCAPLQIRKSER